MSQARGTARLWSSTGMAPVGVSFRAPVRVRVAVSVASRSSRRRISGRSAPRPPKGQVRSRRWSNTGTEPVGAWSPARVRWHTKTIFKLWPPSAPTMFGQWVRARAWTLFYTHSPNIGMAARGQWFQRPMPGPATRFFRRLKGPGNWDLGRRVLCQLARTHPDADRAVRRHPVEHCVQSRSRHRVQPTLGHHGNRQYAMERRRFPKRRVRREYAHRGFMRRRA